MHGAEEGDVKSFILLCFLDLLVFYEGFLGCFYFVVLLGLVLSLLLVLFLWEAQDTQGMWRGAWHCPCPRAGWSRMVVLGLLW